METNFKEGDVVQLKSGSPSMTITGFSPNGKIIYCTWYDFSTFKWSIDQSFPINILKKI